MNRSGKQEAEAATLTAWWCELSPSGRKRPHDYGLFFVAAEKSPSGSAPLYPTYRFGLAGHKTLPPQTHGTRPVMAWDAGSAKYRRHPRPRLRPHLTRM